MTSPFTKDKIENWVSDFCISDGLSPFSPTLRELAGNILLVFLNEACQVRGVDPDELEEVDVRAALLGPTAKLTIPEAVAGEVPTLCGAFLASLEAEGRLGGGRVLGAMVTALKGKFLEEASGKMKPIVRAGSKLGRNDPCPCGSGKKYKKCCLGE